MGEGQNESIDWSNLPEELLDVILDQLLQLLDYIRFGAVCKSFRLVALNQKPKRMATMLAVIRRGKYNDGFNQLSLCNIKEGQFVCNHESQIPSAYDCPIRIYSSHGWLILDPLHDHKSIQLYNPLTRKSIKAPYEFSGAFHKVILSCDPTTCPDDFFIGAICWVDGKGHSVGLKKARRKYWKFCPNNSSTFKYCDIIFHNGLLYALDYQNSLVAFDYSRNKLVSFREIVLRDNAAINVPPRACTPYLVEASDGNLLLVQRVYGGERIQLNDYEDFGRFEIFKLAKKGNYKNPNRDSSEELCWVEITELENNDSIFLANHGYRRSTSASCVPNFNGRNCIYFTHNFKEETSSRKHEDVGVFDPKIGTVTKLRGFGGEEDHPLLLIWITPTLYLY